MPTFLGINLVTLVTTVGYLGVLGIVFAESGLFIGFFLPGDSLLIAAGLLASQGYFYLPFLIYFVVAGAVAGDSVGYAFGRKVGPSIFSREESFFFRRSHITAAEAFYTKYGGRAIVLARFVPVIRTFAPIMAGVGHMPYRRFIVYNVIGGLLWGVGLLALAYFVGSVAPSIDRYILFVMAAIVIFSIIPALVHLYRHSRRR